MKDYQNSKIYSIRSRTSDDIYIGSTTVGIAKRFAKHKSSYKSWVQGNTKKYCSSYKLFEKYDTVDLYYELVEECPCDNIEQLRKIEGGYIREYLEKGACCNKLIAGRRKSEYYIDNREEILKYQVIYQTENKEKIREYKTKYYTKNKERLNKKSLEYYEENREELRVKQGIYGKKYYIENKAEMSKKTKIKITCECGTIVTKCRISRHRKSQKHIKLLNQK